MAPKYINVQGSFGKKKLLKFDLSHMLECLDIYWTKSGHIFFQSIHKIKVCVVGLQLYIYIYIYIYI